MNWLYQKLPNHGLISQAADFEKNTIYFKEPYLVLKKITPFFWFNIESLQISILWVERLRYIITKYKLTATNSYFLAK